MNDMRFTRMSLYAWKRLQNPKAFRRGAEETVPVKTGLEGHCFQEVSSKGPFQNLPIGDAIACSSREKGFGWVAIVAAHGPPKPIR